MKNPDVSIIIPSKNRHRLLAKCVDALVKPPDLEWEILVVDYRSDPPLGLSAWALRPDVRIIPCPTPGPGDARNLGLSMARGRTVKFLDSDDVLNVETLTEQVRACTEENPLVCSTFAYIDGEKESERIEGLGDFKNLTELVVSGYWASTYCYTYLRSRLPGDPWRSGLVMNDDAWFLIDLSRHPWNIRRLPLLAGWARRHEEDVRLSESGDPFLFRLHHLCGVMALETELTYHVRHTPNTRALLAENYEAYATRFMRCGHLWDALSARRHADELRGTRSFIRMLVYPFKWQCREWYGNLRSILRRRFVRGSA
jgi:glycosyltransferase involved in cell wall biosynthesis